MINHPVIRRGRSAEELPTRVPPQVIDLVEAGRPVAQVGADLGISGQTVYAWRRQHLIDIGRLPGGTSAENAELAAARRRIAELETELAIHRRASELLGKVVLRKGDSRPSA